MNGWIGFDLDGTIANYDGFEGAGVIGAPIPDMLRVLRRLIMQEIECRIFTARIYPVMFILPQQDLTPFAEHEEVVEAATAIRKWLEFNNLPPMTITCCKDYGMWKLYDDRAVQVEKNTGKILGVDF